MSRAELQHRWRIHFNYLAGITAGRWWKLLRRERFDVDLVYGHRIALITAMSLVNSVWAAIEQLRFGRRIERVSKVEPPIFILGHYRHGTTLLHNLLAMDQRLSFPTTYAVTNPDTFLTTERFNSRLLRPLLPKIRPQDGMALGFDLPQEDEYALALSSLCSPMLALNFPRSQDRHMASLTMYDVPDEQRQAWKEAFRTFVRKLALRDPRPMVLKSPPHTARITLLLELFPTARFVHIHRNPYRVFQSTRHLFHSSIWLMYLQRPNLEDLDRKILDRYTEMYDAYFEQRSAIPDGQLAEVRFRDLEERPLQTLRRLYESLQLGDFDDAEAGVRRHLESIASYRKNEYPPLQPSERELVAQAWARSFDEWDYPR
jgi:hypothetical protein